MTLDLLTVGMLVALGIAVAGVLRGGTAARLVAAQAAGVIAIQLVLLRSVAPGVGYLADVALLFAVMSVIGSLLLVRFLERWL